MDYLLDTNILVHYVRQDKIWTEIRRTYNLFLAKPTPIVCVVSHGELRSFSTQRQWAKSNINLLDFALSYFKKLSIDDPDIIDAYAAIDADCKSRGFSLGKNDLWIVATATLTGATLITTDRDFDAIDPAFLTRVWFDPTFR